MGSRGGAGRREKKPRVRTRPRPVPDKDGSPLWVSGSSGPGQPGWQSTERTQAGTVVLRGQERPLLLPGWLFRGTRGRILAVRGPRLGLSCPRDHFPSPRWHRTSYGEVPALPAPRFPLLALQIPGWGQGAGVSQWRPFRALRGRLLEMENVSPQPYLGWKQLSPPHTLCSPCLCRKRQASPPRLVCCFFFSLCVAWLSTETRGRCSSAGTKRAPCWSGRPGSSTLLPPSPIKTTLRILYASLCRAPRIHTF